MAGTKELKELLALPLSIHMAYDLAMADGKLDLADLALLMGPAMKIGPALQGIDKVPGELKDMDDAEKKDVLDWAKTMYNISDDVLEKKVEDALGLALHIAQFVGKLVK